MGYKGVTERRICELLEPFYPGIEAPLSEKLLLYLELLLRWNQVSNLTAVRNPEEIVTRHFGESLFCAQLVPLGARTLLDVGSGAGFPGLPVALVRPELEVTLAESQGKKAAFLHEAVRRLRTENVSIWAGRVEAISPTRMFDVATLRAVDSPGNALKQAEARVRSGGALIQLCTAATARQGSLVMELPGSEMRVAACSLME